MTKTESAQVKGIALILMFWHHLFGGGSYLTLPENNWLPVISERLVLTIAGEDSACLFMFLFCSGFGLYFSFYSRRTGLKDWLMRFIRILIPYWLIMAATIVYLAARGNFHPEYLPMNLFAAVRDDERLYVSFSWFIKIYLEIIAVLPLLRLLDRKLGRKPWLEAPLYLIVPGIVSSLIWDYVFNLENHRIVFLLVYALAEVCEWLPLFLIGMLAAKYRLLEKLWNFLKKIHPLLLAAISVGIVWLILLGRYRQVLQRYQMLAWLQALLLVTAFLALIRLSRVQHPRVLPFLGNNSLYYWLLSGFFFLNTVELQFMIYFPRYSVLILLWQILLETPFVILFQHASEAVLRQISNCLRMTPK